MINNFEEKINAIQARIDELQKDIDKLMGTTAEPVKWSPVGGEYYVCNGNTIKAPSSMNAPREFGIERPTKEQAERSAVEMRRFNRLLALRDELCEGEIGDGIEKFHITYLIQDARWFSSSGYPQYDGVHVHFKTNRAAQRACDMLNSGEVEL